MKEIFREYNDDDYEQCEALVNQAWKFNKIFYPQALSDLAKTLYTKGSVLSSNYRRVVEIDGKIAGFIFGLNAHAKKPGRNILFGLTILYRLLRVKSEKPNDKKALLNAIQVHQQNRNKLIKTGTSEITLFVVGKEHQGKGFGKSFWSGFLSECTNSDVAEIIVETNKLGASSFYEQLGFKHIGDFDSPLHEAATQGGQACMYKYLC